MWIDLALGRFKMALDADQKATICALDGFDHAVWRPNDSMVQRVDRQFITAKDPSQVRVGRQAQRMRQIRPVLASIRK
ncbi:MAG: hypothetical protein J7463_05095 [Roseiflexus sp.]|jgi:hypothetical protein|nr:hypothetical protein [Roseiflexus sp.]MBO9333567.1 hypothetical protein [Roseiflexus sp.]MBO9340924.1 hypothetical protein [Roseiflexus sp.]MBO9363366.1 hypothetical protein [Roseiflexus sp.]MBO9380976.1 hypothetical protein [Roseiflexus sp.]